MGIYAIFDNLTIQLIYPPLPQAELEVQLKRGLKQPCMHSINYPSLPCTLPSDLNVVQ